MFQILKDPNFDFMGKRNLLLPVSLVVVLLSVVVLMVNGLNLGIEFTGGTEMQVKYAQTPDVGEIRAQLADVGQSGAIVTTIGDHADNEVYIRLATGAQQEDEDPTAEVLSALRQVPARAERRVDLNIDDKTTLTALLVPAPDLSSTRAGEIADEILNARREGKIFSSFTEMAEFGGVTPDVIAYLEENADIGPLALRSQSFIGPAVGRELVEKAVIAIIGSLVGMLLYIWVRFKLQWGLAAVVALAHDALITLALFSLFDQEMSLPVVAAFLTLVGYSVNDTVVVFDRIRENLAAFRSKPLVDVVDLSINQTLSRTIITSGLTWIVVLSLFLFGGAALRPFSFVLTIGVVVGTYSSVFVAAPIVVIWQSYLDRKRQPGGSKSRPQQPATKAKKVRGVKTG